MEKIIKKIFYDIGVHISWRGYKMWITAVSIATEEELTMQELYVEIARHHKSTRTRVERALRYVVEENRERIQKYFGIEYKITNKIFLNLLIEKVLLFVEQEKMS